MVLKYPIKYLGAGFWVEESDAAKGIVQTAIRKSSEELSIDFTEDGLEYTVTLTRQHGNIFAGVWFVRNDVKNKHQVSCRMYSYEQDILLVGSWHENDEVFNWVMELERPEI